MKNKNYGLEYAIALQQKLADNKIFLPMGVIKGLTHTDNEELDTIEIVLLINKHTYINEGGVKKFSKEKYTINEDNKEYKNFYLLTTDLDEIEMEGFELDSNKFEETLKNISKEEVKNILKNITPTKKQKIIS